MKHICFIGRLFSVNTNKARVKESRKTFWNQHKKINCSIYGGNSVKYDGEQYKQAWRVDRYANNSCVFYHVYVIYDLDGGNL